MPGAQAGATTRKLAGGRYCTSDLLMAPRAKDRLAYGNMVDSLERLPSQSMSTRNRCPSCGSWTWDSHCLTVTIKAVSHCKLGGSRQRLLGSWKWQSLGAKRHKADIMLGMSWSLGGGGNYSAVMGDAEGQRKELGVWTLKRQAPSRLRRVK